MNAPQCYVIPTLPVLFNTSKHCSCKFGGFCCSHNRNSCFSCVGSSSWQTPSYQQHHNACIWHICSIWFLITNQVGRLTGDGRWQRGLTGAKLAVLLHWLYGYIGCTVTLAVLLHWLYCYSGCTVTLAVLLHWLYCYISVCLTSDICIKRL